MSRLSSEFERLYPSEAHAAGGDARDHARAFVLELSRPADWALLGRIFRGVQTDLGLPAPAIAVSGAGLQLWFSLRQPIASARARAFLGALERRWLADVVGRRVGFHVHAPDAPVPRVPAAQEGGELWSAFVAPDLAAMFTDTPWLDVEPNEEGQANLLRGLRPATPDEFEAAERQLADDAARAAAPAITPPPASPAAAPLRAAGPPTTDPREFLLGVMNDAAVPLALRIDAARALLR
jgi:hypothetical protein